MTIKEWIKKDEVMDIIKGLPQDLWEEYIYMLKGVWCDEDMKIEPVVHCKDCKYWQDNNGGYPHEECRWGKEETPDETDFCSYGERKEP